jgi:phage terminase Nu1 subunit (DNA packaging protein)
LQDQMKTSELAALFGVSSETVRGLARSGVIARAGRLFPVAESTKRYAAHLREAAAGRGRASGAASAIGERSRLAAAQADSQELKNRIARGDLISLSETEATWAEIVVRARNAVLNGVKRWAAELPHLARSDIATFDRIMRDALTTLGKGQ